VGGDSNASGGGSVAGQTVLAVFAHPDDESLACGGTLARLADAGAHVVLVCASHGESGSISDAALVPDGDLGRVRVAELREAAAVLGIAELLVFDHPDGQLRWANVPRLHAEILMVIGRTRPDIVITFDADGLYWHLDHVAVHERTTTAVRSLGADAPPLYYVTMPKGVMRELMGAAAASNEAPANSSIWGIEPDAFGDHAAAPSFVVDVREWVGRKLEALRRHRTQMGPRNPFAWLDEPQARRWLGVEQFRRAPLASAREGLLERLGEPVASL
jgi:N-acetyl-1-D-myo-inositol-2-amino-2-deoxy-alpha-D-glucopyranoside deacetylase